MWVHWIALYYVRAGLESISYNRLAQNIFRFAQRSSLTLGRLTIEVRMSHLKLNSCQEYINFPYLVLFLRWRWVVPHQAVCFPPFFLMLRQVQNSFKMATRRYLHSGSQFYLWWNLCPRIPHGFLSEFSEPRWPQILSIPWLRKWILDIALSNSLNSSDTFQGMHPIHSHSWHSLKVRNPPTPLVITTSRMTLGYGPTTTLFILEL